MSRSQRARGAIDLDVFDLLLHRAEFGEHDTFGIHVLAQLPIRHLFHPFLDLRGALRLAEIAADLAFRPRLGHEARSTPGGELD